METWDPETLLDLKIDIEWLHVLGDSRFYAAVFISLWFCVYKVMLSRLG